MNRIELINYKIEEAIKSIKFHKEIIEEKELELELLKKEVKSWCL